MDIGTIVAGLQAIASIADTMNKAPQLTPAQAEEKPKKAQQPMNTFIILPNQTPPMGVGVPPAEMLAPMPYEPMYTEPRQATEMLRRLFARRPAEPTQGFYRDLPNSAVDMPMYQIPPNMRFPSFNPDPLLWELFQLYYGLR